MVYVPDRGDVIWLELNPQAGHEQAGYRPVVVLTPRSYNDKTSLALACPITNQRKKFPFEIIIPAGLPVTGVILVDHVKSLDWRARNARFICPLPLSVQSELLQKLATLLTLPSS